MFILLIIIANTLFINNWELLYRGAWIPSNTTSTNIQDLINSNIIQDGPINIMTQDYSKIIEKQWIYRSISVLNITNAEIIFEGIDTIASIYVNNLKVICANNMFIKYYYYIGDIDGLLNITAIFTEITNNLDKGQFAHAQVRKAAYQFRWDFCYKLLQVGFWRPVSINSRTIVQIRNIYIQTKQIDKLQAEIDVSFDIIGDSDYSVLLQINYNKIIIDEKLLNKEEKVKERIKISQPQLWWPNGYGGQSIYTLRILIYNQQKEIITHQEQKFGIRISKLIQQTDEDGQSFLFLFNGKQIYIKGSNYSPTDMITTKIRQNYEQVFKDTLSMQCNALRIWGGGIYEDDQFYDLADKYGILIWQDFMFANAVYPDTQEFLSNVENEIRQNVERLRNHPSILLWAGNNEIHQGMLSWGYNAINGAPQIYKNLFQTLIPNIIEELDPQIDYIHSSPLYLYRDKQMGEIHDWMIFHQLENIEDLHQSSGRFVSEYGNQAYPDFSTFKVLKMNLTPEAYQNMNQYISNYFNRTREILATVYFSNCVQYMTYQTAAIAHRILKPYNMGTIFWQLQDSAPLATWSVIDILKCKKGGFYAIKKFYNKLILGFKYVQQQLLVYAVSEYEQIIEGQVNLQVIYIQNNTLLYNITKNITTNQHFSEHINTLNISDETAQSVFVTMKFYNNQFNYNYTYTIKRPNQLMLRKPEIRILLQNQQLVMTTQYFAKLVYVHNWYQCLNPSDNYFDLVPGEKKIITFEAKNLTIKDIGFKAYY